MTEHTFFRCPQPCEVIHCKYCDGGLQFCTTCRQAESELEDQCPGAPQLGEPVHLRYETEGMAQLRQILRTAGFSDVIIDEFNLCLTALERQGFKLIRA